jgi:hypothetical protein
VARSASRFDPEFSDALREWISHVCTWLGIGEWTIVLINEPPGDLQAAASIECIYGRRWADLSIATDFFNEPPEKQRHYLLHELCHIVLDPVDKVLHYSDMNIMAGIPAWKVFLSAYTLALENVVDHWATIVEDFFNDEKEYVTYHKLWDAVIAAESEATPVAKDEEYESDDGKNDEDGPEHDGTVPPGVVDVL